MKTLTLALLCGALADPAFAADAPVTPVLPIISNGNMEDGTDAPTGWKKEWVGTGDLKMARDTEVFHNGKAALRVEPTQGEAKGLVATYGDALPDTSVTL